MSAQDMLYSPTPMKRRTTSEHKCTRRSSDTMSGAMATDVREAMKNNSQSPKFSMNKKAFDDCSKHSKRSTQDSLSSKMGSTVPMEDSESDSEESFFADDVSQSPKPVGSESPKEPNGSTTKKRDKSKTKKKKDKSDKKKKKKDKSDKPKKKREKSEKSKKKRDKSQKSAVKSPKDGNSKEPSLFDALNEQNAIAATSESDQESGFSGEAFQGSHYVVPQIQQQEQAQELPYGPPLWGDTEEENSFGDVWEEDQSCNGWDWERADDEKSEYAEESLCDDASQDGFSYYTVQSNDDLGFPEADDIDDDATGWNEIPVSTKPTKSPKSVFFNDCETIHDTLHICDFTEKEITRCWYQQNDYEETIQGVREVASSSETPRDTQTRLRRQRSLSSKSAETRGLEAWTPSGVQRFRYVKEAAFRAVWDEQQKQIDRLDEEYGDENSVDNADNIEKLRQAYHRVSIKSQREAHERAKSDADIAEKLRPRKSMQRGRKGDLSRFKKSMGTSGRMLLDNNGNNDLSDSPAAPASCLRNTIDTIDEAPSPSTDEANKRAWLGDSPRGVARIGLFKQSSDRSLFKQKSGRSLFKQSSALGLFKRKSERGLFKQSSDRGLFKKKSDRGLFKQPSDLSLFKKHSEFDAISEELDEEQSTDMEKPKTIPRGSFEFGLFNSRKSTGGSERQSRSINELDSTSEHVRQSRPRRGLSRQNSEPVIAQKNSLVSQ